MKIISKFKDYYDYLQGIYGQDPKATYERFHEVSKDAGGYYGYKIFPVTWDELTSFPNSNQTKVLNLAICGFGYPVIFYFGKVYLIPWDHSTEEKIKYDRNKFMKEQTKDWPTEVKVLLNDARTVNFLMGTDVNKKENCPIVVLDDYSYGQRARFKNPMLKHFGVAAGISPEFMFNMITSWILEQNSEGIPATTTDKSKILSHGMDPERSFRPNMKK